MSQPKPIVRFDTAGIVRRVHKAAEDAMPEITKKIQEDCNDLAPFRSGTLVSTSNINTDAGELKSEIKWIEPYSNYVYKGVSKSGKDLNYNKHPHTEAGSHWCERAKKLHFSEWVKMVDKCIKEHFRNGS